MPIYLDRHEATEELTPEDVAHIHLQDLKVQDDFDCRVISYYFDQKKNQAFCLVEAPDKESMIAMHNHSHGQLPNKVIEVDENSLEAFFGGIDKPKTEPETELYINRASPIRIIMVINLLRSSLSSSASESVIQLLQDYNKSITDIIARNQGTIVEQKVDDFLVSFKSASNAITCALEIQDSFNKLNDIVKKGFLYLKIGIDVGVPVTEEEHLFERTVIFAKRMCNMVKEQIVVSFEVEKRYKDEKLSVFKEGNRVHTLNPSDEKFLNSLMDHLESSWSDPGFNVNDFGRQLGYSKSQLYRKMVALTGKSPVSMIKDYRLYKALLLLDEQKKNITQIAYEIGFNSPAYFSKCFQEKYGILPSEYTKFSARNT